MVEQAIGGVETLSWFLAPTELDEAVRAVAGGALVLAGGTDLVPVLAAGSHPEGVVWIGRLGLDTVSSDGNTLSIGATTSLAEIGSNPTIQETATALASAAGSLAGPAVRNLATVVGSLCAAWPRSDIGCSLLALEAVAVASGPKGERTIPLTEFYLGSGRTSVRPDEIVTKITLQPAAMSAFVKIGRRAHMSLPVVNAAARLDLDENEVVSKAVVAVGAGHHPQRAKSVEESLIGCPAESPRVREAAQLVLDDVETVDDEHGTAWYRARIAPVAVARAVEAALAGGSA